MNNSAEVLSQSVVVFSKNYMPVNRINVKRAILLLVSEKAEPLELNGCKPITIHSPNIVFFVPQYIRLKGAHAERTWRVPPVTRRELLRRDKHNCQYCGSTKKLTLDHVIPRSKGGKHSWDNIVIACEQCNSRKGDRTPQQAGMILHTVPKSPAHPAVLFAEEFWRNHGLLVE